MEANLLQTIRKGALPCISRVKQIIRKKNAHLNRFSHQLYLKNGMIPKLELRFYDGHLFFQQREHIQLFGSNTTNKFLTKISSNQM